MYDTYFLSQVFGNYYPEFITQFYETIIDANDLVQYDEYMIAVAIIFDFAFRNHDVQYINGDGDVSITYIPSGFSNLDPPGHMTLLYEEIDD